MSENTFDPDVSPSMAAQQLVIELIRSNKIGLSANVDPAVAELKNAHKAFYEYFLSLKKED
ncbi:MAG TPA: hypothetical protein ACHBX6_10705 [Arsenophonus nasoniae]|uniref:hypothetical protein n=1 Tax=Arsenophonus nasoniae TaxID=638 RepID=UPI003879180A